MSFSSVLIRCVLACFFCTVVVRAHQPYEITTTARVENERLVMTLTMAVEAATAMLAQREPVEETQALNRGNFPQFQRRIEAQAHGYFQVRAGEVALAVIGAVARMNGEGELEVTLRYPGPAQWPLRGRPTFLELLPQGYGNTFTMFDAQDRAWGRWLQTGANKVTEIAAPPVAEIGEVVAAMIASAAEQPLQPFSQLLWPLEQVLWPSEHLPARRFHRLAPRFTAVTAANSHARVANRSQLFLRSFGWS